MRWDGEIWAIDTRPSAGWREYHEFARADEPSFGNPTPEFAASLPDHPDALRTYLDEHVSGSNVTIVNAGRKLTPFCRAGSRPRRNTPAR